MRRTVAAVVALLLIVGAGCGDGRDTTTTTKPTEPVRPPPPANPEAVLDHFLCYRTVREPIEPPGTIEVSDQFHDGARREITVDRLDWLCNPADKNHKRRKFPNAHLLCYAAADPTPLDTAVQISNQFDPILGREQFSLISSVLHLCLPTAKVLKGEPPPIPQEVDHFLCYKTDAKVEGVVKVTDQFVTGVGFEFVVLDWLCNPVEKFVDGKSQGKPRNPEAHLACYKSMTGKSVDRNVIFRNQFQPEPLGLHIAFRPPEYLCVPSTKKVVPKPK